VNCVAHVARMGR